MPNQNEAWLGSWIDAQQSYWKSWADMAQRGMKIPEPQRAPWAQGLDQWWKTVSTGVPVEARVVFDRIMSLSRDYFQLAERFAGARPDGDGMAVFNQWLSSMQNQWQDWMQQGTTLRPDMLGKEMMAFWDLPMDTWNRMTANLVPMPGDFTQAFHGDPNQFQGRLQEDFNRFMSVPAVGYSREFQEQYQRLAQLYMEYNAALQAYQIAFAKVAVDGTQKFQKQMQAMSNEGEAYATLREAYDAWVESSEASYADFVMTPEYQQLYGRLVNSLMALKHMLARLVDQNLEAMHMPTHAEISTLQMRQQELRRDNHKLRKDIRGLQDEMMALRQQLLSGAVAKPAAAKPVAKPVAKPAAKVATKPASTTAAKPAAKTTRGARK